VKPRQIRIHAGVGDALETSEGSKDA
jgi:hypothetical protein